MMTFSTKIRSQRSDSYTELKVLISHPMENGRNRDPVTGELIPAHFIRELSITLNSHVVIAINMAGSVSKNPFFNFRLKNVNSGDRIAVSWIDNRNLGETAEHYVD